MMNLPITICSKPKVAVSGKFFWQVKKISSAPATIKGDFFCPLKYTYRFVSLISVCLTFTSLSVYKMRTSFILVEIMSRFCLFLKIFLNIKQNFRGGDLKKSVRGYTSLADRLGILKSMLQNLFTSM
mgnify:FL=1